MMNDEAARDGIEWITSIVERFPKRVVGSDDERGAQEALAEDLRDAGVDEAVLLPFKHGRSLYANMSLHFFLVVVGAGLTVAGIPAAGAALQLFAGLSYWLESSKRTRLLGRIFPRHATQNLVATRRAAGDMRHRFVFVGHIDAAFTGLIFEPEMIKKALTPPPIPGLGFVTRGMLMAELSALGSAALSIAVLAGAPIPAIGVYIAAVALAIPAFLTFALNLQVVLRNETVPGANDNLTGCYAALHLARRLCGSAPDDVELVFVATGAEEAGTGGAWHLAESLDWSTDNTTVLGLDSLSNGDLRYFQEGELSYFDVPARLESLVKEVVPEVEKYPIPSGATDALPFLVRGYEAMTFGCVDREIRAPRHYHHPSDTPENLNHEEFSRSLAAVDRFVDKLLEVSV
jgi:hypothetical protein